MKLSSISETGSERLILLFAGYGMDAGVFSALCRDGYDIKVVYDYRDLEFPFSALEGYEEIVVAGWSMGVYYAARFVLDHPQLPVTRCVAVNGTLAPIDDRLGIPEKIYDLTTALPDQRAVDKFLRRVCGGQSAMSVLMPRLPERDVESLRAELLAIRDLVKADSADGRDMTSAAALFDEVFISDADLIFPPDNMVRAWEGISGRMTMLPGAAHAIDFKWLIDIDFVDKGLVGSRFGATHKSYDESAEAQRRVARRLMREAARKGFATRGARLLEIGSGGGMLTSLYIPSLVDCHLTLWDLAPKEVASGSGNRVDMEAVDAETAIRRVPNGTFDTVLSSSTIQWFNSPVKFVNQVVRTLKPGGMAFISYYGKGTLQPMEGLGGLRYPSITAHDLSGCEVECLSERVTLKFDSAADALKHIRRTGVNSLTRKPLPVTELRRIMEGITDDDGGATLNFEANYLIITKQ